MTKQHRVTPEEWESIELHAEDNLYDACLLGLRARIEALEAAQQKVRSGPAQPNSITLKSGTIPEETIRLDSKGFYYRGQLIEDAGEAHRLFVEFMRQSSQTHHINQPTSGTH